ncbi:MAG: PAS domain S-box protein [Microcystaceae cyanobacterium]
MLRKFRIRTTLMIPFVVQILAAVGLVGLVIYRSGEQSVQEVATGLRTELTNRIIQKLDSYTTVPKRINRLNATAFAYGDIEINQLEGYHLLWQQMQIYQTLSYVYCSDEQGGFLGVGRLSDNDRSEVLLVYSNAETNFLRQDFSVDQRGNIQTKVGTLNKPYDPRVRPWYRAAKQANSSVWSEIYLSFSTLNPTVTASIPVYNREDNSLIGVCATDFFLPEEANHFLKNLEIGQTGTAFIIERTGKLVAKSSSEPLIEKRGNTSQRLLATESSNPTIKGTAEYLNTHFKNLNEIQSSLQLDFKLNGKRQYVQVVPFRDDNLDWLVVLTIPEADFMSKIHTSRRNAIALCIGGLGIAVLIGMLMTRWISQPIWRVSQASDHIAQRDLNQQIQPSFIIEIDTLAKSFNSMIKQLKDSFTTLERKNDELRIAEESYRSIFENSVEGIFQSSPNGRFLRVNLALAAIYGYESPEEMIESITNISQQLYVDLEKRIEFKNLLEKQDKIRNFEYRCYCKDGSIIWTEIDARVVKDNQGIVLYYEGIVRDITKRKYREEKLKRQLEELQIEIDENKRQEEVEQLTQSGYFQDVQQEIEKLNLDEFWG